MAMAALEDGFALGLLESCWCQLQTGAEKSIAGGLRGGSAAIFTSRLSLATLCCITGAWSGGKHHRFCKLPASIRQVSVNQRLKAVSPLRIRQWQLCHSSKHSSAINLASTVLKYRREALHGWQRL